METKKKLKLISQLDAILSNNCVNNQVSHYTFDSIHTLIINETKYHITNMVEFILYFDEICVKIYEDEDKYRSYTLPYLFVDNIQILLRGDE